MYLGIILLAIAVVLSLFGAAARVRAAQIERRQRFRDEFFASAKTLVEDNRTPEIVVEVTEFLGRAIADKHLTWLALWHLFNGDVNRRSEQAQGRPIEELVSIPPDLMEIFRHLNKAFVLAITFNNFIVGALFRRLFLWPAKLAKRHDGPCDDGDGVGDLDNERARVVVTDLVESRFLTPQHAAA